MELLAVDEFLTAEENPDIEDEEGKTVLLAIAMAVSDAAVGGDCCRCCSVGLSPPLKESTLTMPPRVPSSGASAWAIASLLALSSTSLAQGALVNSS